jgi:hypothetical protein
MSTRYHSTIIKAHPLPQSPLHADESVDDLLAEADALVEEAERMAAVQVTRKRLDSIDQLCAQVDSLFDD